MKLTVLKFICVHHMQLFQYEDHSHYCVVKSIPHGNCAFIMTEYAHLRILSCCLLLGL